MQALDRSHSGVVSLTNFKQGLSDLGIGLTAQQVDALVVAEGGGEFITYQDMLDKYSTRVSSLADIAQRRSSSGVCDAFENLLPCVSGACVRMYTHLVRVLYRHLAESV